MKYLTEAVSLMILLAVHVPAWAQEAADTVAVVERAERVVVTRLGNVTNVEAEIADTAGGCATVFNYELRVDSVGAADPGDAWNFDYPFMPEIEEDAARPSRRLRRSIVAMRHLYWGWRFNYGDKGLVKNCFEVGWKEIIGVSFSRGRDLPSVSTGLGLGAQLYHAREGYMYEPAEGRVRFVAAPEGADVHSCLGVMTFHVPVMLTQKIGKYVDFTLAGILNFNTWAVVDNRVKYKDTVHKARYRGLHQNLFTADLFASIGIGGFGIYAAWSPMKLFNAPYGPEVKGWSIGLNLVY